MSAAEADDAPHHEIVIVRHGHGDHDDGHHGGVWKIAFADFMTAMMCFFLVMWLINASNEQTKAAVASYFNPVKLIDRNSSRKGLEDIGDGPNSAGNDDEVSEKSNEDSKSGPADSQGSVDTSSSAKQADEELFADPYAVLAEIASETGTMQNVSDKGDGGAQSSGPANGAEGGEAYRDPFAPDFWSQQMENPTEAEATADPQGVAATGGEGPEDAAGQSAVAVAAPTPDEAVEPFPAAPEEKPAEPEPKAAPEAKTEPEPKQPEKAEQAEKVKPKPASHEPSAETIKAADQIRRELAEALDAGDKLKDGISVVATEKGVQVSVTDQLEFGMFEVGSALPRRELVLAMEKIGKAIGEQKGTVTISGHTDARPFKSETYDNWRLSTSRAHSAYYMLVRGGLDEKRITEVAGFADRKLKLPSDPLAATNRRIEILLEIGG